MDQPTPGISCRRSCFLISFLVCLSLGGWAARPSAGAGPGGITVASISDGAWEDSGTWDARVPLPVDDAVIGLAHTVTITGKTQIAVYSLLVVGELTHASNANERLSLIDVQASESVWIQSTARIAASSRGHGGGASFQHGRGLGGGQSGVRGGGGGHAGRGGRGTGFGGARYGWALTPADLGSGGGGGTEPLTSGGGGGAAILIMADLGQLQHRW